MRHTIPQPAAPANLTLKAIRLTQKMRNGAVPAFTLDEDEVAIVVSEVIRNVDRYSGPVAREGAFWWLLFIDLCTIENPAALVVYEWLVLGRGLLGQILRARPGKECIERFRVHGCAYRGVAE